MFEKEYCVVRKIMFVTHRNVAAGAVFEFKCFVAKVLNQLRRSIVWVAQALCGKKKNRTKRNSSDRMDCQVALCGK